LHTNTALAEKLQQLGEELRFVLITSKATVNVVDSAPEGALATDIAGLWLTVTPADGIKCERCWHVTEDIGQDEKHPELCGRCITNVEGDGETRQFA
jgi:isoleucyl-tRNA synthetase